MKVLICGNLIDTEMIYCIGKVKFFHWANGDLVSTRLDYYKDEVGFKINFINKLTETIYLPYNIPENVAKVEKVREELIKFWSTGQIKIPKIDFE